MRRVMIIGQPGAGKSTLARQMGGIVHLPVVHIDHIHWKSGWVERTPEEKARLCHAVHMRDRWIFEGGHSRTWPERLARADTLIWLDLPVGRRLWRVARRTIRFLGRARPDLPDGCPEQVSPAFYAYIWRTRNSARERCRALFDGAGPDTATHHLRRPAEIRAYLDALRRAVAVGNLGVSHR